MSNANERAKSLDEVINSIRDLYTVKLTIPLGNPNLKLVHTNQFLFTELPTDVFELINLPTIAKALNSKYSRYSGYVLNRWYIEGITITRDGKSAKMELELNPFATPLIKYQENNRGFVKAYTDAFNQNKTNTSNNKTTSKKKVKSVDSTLDLKNVKGYKKSDQEYIKKIVKKALKKAGYPKKKFKQAKALHDYYKENHVWVKYNDMPKMCSKGFEGCWKAYQHNCGDGAATIAAMFKCIGLNPNIYLGHHHYWVKVKIDGTYYYCDNAANTNQHTSRVLGSKGNNSNVWGGTSDGSIHNSYC